MTARPEPIPPRVCRVRRNAGAATWLTAFLLAWAAGAAWAGGTAVSSLPTTALPGVAFTVQITATPDNAVSVFAVQDEVPAGWAVSDVTASGQFDAAHHRVKWGPFFDHTSRVLSYKVTPTATAAGDYTFAGLAVFNDLTVAVAGTRQTRVLTGADANVVSCLVPARFLPGQAFGLTNRAVPAANVTVYAIEDQVPAGWTVSAISGGGTFDAGRQKLKWGPFFDAQPRVLTCQITPPTDARGAFTFAGSGSFDGVPVAITGSREIQSVVSAVVSTLPGRFQPSVPITVSLAVTPEPGIAVQAIQDQLPVGWTAGAISGGGLFDAANRSVKWGPFFDATSRVLTYQATPPASGEALVEFVGRGAFDGFDVPITGQRQTSGQPTSLVCSMPAQYSPGVAFSVSIAATPDPTVKVYAVQDRLPTGWSAAAVNAGGTFDAANGLVKWGPFFDNQSRTLSYQAMPPALAANDVEFAGEGSFDGATVAMTGQRNVALLPFDQVNGVTRALPATLRAGVPTVVSNTVRVAANVAVYAVEDKTPTGWTVGGISDGGAFDAGQSKVKWGPFFDNTPRVLTYTLTAPLAAEGVAGFGGQASFDGIALPIGGAQSVQAIKNRAPVARADAAERERGQPVTVTAASLLANDSDPDGDPLVLASVTATSARGGTVGLKTDQVTYTPPAGFEDADTFTYTIQDGFGGSATGTVTVTVTAPVQDQIITKIEKLAGGTVRIHFTGTPGRTYRIEATDSLRLPNWTSLRSVVADASGAFTLDDADTATRFSRFYRSAAP